jgi:hypothetical protein
MKRSFIRKIQVLAIVLCLTIFVTVAYERAIQIEIQREKVSMSKRQWEKISRDPDILMEYSRDIKRVNPLNLPDWFDYMFYFAYFVIASGAVIVITNNFKDKS